MNKLINYFLAFAIVATISSCQKQDEISLEYAGVYEVYKYELKYYSENGTKLDSIFTDEDLGTINLKLENPSLEQNYMSFDLKGGRLIGWQNIPSSTPITWATADKNEKIIMFSNAPDGDPFLNEITLVSYNVDFKLFDKQIWSYIEVDANGAMKREELVYLRKY